MMHIIPAYRVQSFSETWGYVWDEINIYLPMNNLNWSIRLRKSLHLGSLPCPRWMEMDRPTLQTLGILFVSIPILPCLEYKTLNWRRRWKAFGWARCVHCRVTGGRRCNAEMPTGPIRKTGSSEFQYHAWLDLHLASDFLATKSIYDLLKPKRGYSTLLLRWGESFPWISSQCVIEWKGTFSVQLPLQMADLSLT